MCVQCEGRPASEVVADHRRRVRTHGWSPAHVRAAAAGRAGHSYTIGMTRHHGHPEFLVSGLTRSEAGTLLGDLATQVRAGLRLSAGQVLGPDDGARLQFVPVADPALLTHAQMIYAGPAGPVPALQVVWSDREGHWPWQQGWPGRAADQPLFGLPLHH